jgi:hypothetical protein
LTPTLPATRFRGYFLLWLIGLCVMAAPPLVGYLDGQVQWPQLWQGNWAMHWLPTLLAFTQPGEASQLGGLTTPLFHELLTPLLCLAVGALCFNFDRRVTWFLLTWVGCGLLGAIMLPATAPSWPALLPIVPAIGLLLALGLDRLRATILQSVGAWGSNLFNYLLMGLLLWVGVNNSVAYYHFAQQQVDGLSVLGHELRAIPADRPVVVVGLPAATAVTPQLRFFTNDWRRPTRATVTFAETLPAELPANAIVLLVPADPATLAQLQIRYPTGTLIVRRDHLVNLLLYRYTIGPKSL